VPDRAEDREIERKFLLRRLPDAVRGVVPVRIEQGWLPGTVIHERVRRISGPEGVTHWRTIKLGRGIERQEFEEEATAELFAGLWALTDGRRVVKDRYRVPAGDLVWEVDAFVGRDLVLAEVELPDRDAPVPMPPWLVGDLVREVTDEPAYLNLTLAG